MTEAVVTVCFLITALIHFLPVVGVLGAERLAALYSVSIDDPSLEILMRHRAVMFGILGGLLLGAAFLPAWRPVGLAVGFASVLSFLGIAPAVGGYNSAIRKVVIADVVALLCLCCAGAGLLLS